MTEQISGSCLMPGCGFVSVHSGGDPDVIAKALDEHHAEAHRGQMTMDATELPPALTPGAEVARRENCWRIAEAFMEDWNTRSHHSSGRVGSQNLYDMTMRLAHFLAGQEP